MRRNTTNLITLIALMLLSLNVSAANGEKAISAEQIAMDHVQAKFKQQELVLKDHRVSLVGEHFYFQNEMNDIEVEGDDYVVSINKDGNVYNVYDGIKPIDKKQTKSMVRINIITDEAAFDIAWAHLRVHGTLIDAPTIRKVYKFVGKHLKMVLITQINVTKPYGYWEHEIDGVTGEILSFRNTSITRIKMTWKTDFETHKGAIANRADAVNAISAKRSMNKMNELSGFVSGTALVFDPNPAVTLNDESLNDNSPAREFEAAYISVEIKQLTLKNGKHILKGPFAHIDDFESPSTAASTTTDGNWNAKRGDNAFNDVNTYYHIDQNQRYIQSLGFTGDKAFLNFPIKIDTDGVQGSDNSHFIPSTNKLAFGHGCVDDNEDTDVILHEYGHAIQHNIVPRWRGGDTGAMGEGFGDYWAASYSSSRPNGMDYHPEWVFKWDGHNKCWGGRKLDATNMVYNERTRYGAHSRVSGGTSDELWSTPLFQAFLELKAQGYPRSDMDKIVLESHYGIGSGPNMRDLAKLTVKAARALFPNGPHADVYLAKFKAQNIIE